MNFSQNKWSDEPVGSSFDETRDLKTALDEHASIAIRADITERKAAEMASIRLAAIVEFSDDAIIGKDLNIIITSWNKARKRFSAIRPARWLGLQSSG